MEKKKENRGGRREGQGIKPKYGEGVKTKMLQITIPLELDAEIKTLIESYCALKGFKLANKKRI